MWTDVQTAASRRSPERHTLSIQKYALLVTVSGATLALDCLTKAWARSHLRPFRPVHWGPYITWALKRNDSLRLLPCLHGEVARALLPLLMAVAAIAVWIAYRGMRANAPLLAWGYAFIFGGALGNLLDRLQFGYVTDFIDLHLAVGGLERHSATINIADITIAVGAGLLVVGAARPATRPI